MVLGIYLFRCCTFIDQIDDAHVRNARVRLKADFAGAAIGVAYLNVVGLNLWTELAQTVLVELREGEATVTGKAATADALGQEDIRGTQLGQGNHVLVHTHQAR